MNTPFNDAVLTTCSVEWGWIIVMINEWIRI